ncbi:hypothetical protein [Bradyrhizobium erythrophlei]|jgi:hypothetical protein|uniref:Uncharacterized protein n=1 Tax=Bradyrhizobium erythrophlei TaxID=1437360 RepID=A0A1M5LZ75_9BRAD|nr:hypothetical protein [Bradyrhizobium erythrophlei]SHG69703.1 hypothetical protein SAMN05444169_3712 [Bradyrhizobium erythrophlei]
MDDEFLNAIDKTADPSFNAGDIDVPPKIAIRRSGSSRVGFLRPGEREKCLLDGDDHPYPIENEPAPKYLGPPSGRAGTDDEKRGAYHLYAEYIAGRLGKNEEENGRLWNTALWIDKHFRVTTTPAEALPPLNIYVGDKKSQSTEGTGAPTGPDDEAPDEAGNEGFGFKNFNICATDESGNATVTDVDGITHRLEIKGDNYRIGRLIDDLREIDQLAKIDVNDLRREGPPLLPQVDFPDLDQRAESGKIIRMLMFGMRSLWHPVIRAIASHEDMKSFGQGKGKDVAAAVGRQRIIEGLRLAESIRKGLGRQDRAFSVWQSQIRARQIRVDRPGFSVDDIIKGTLGVLAGNAYQNQTAGLVIKLADKPLPANDNHRFDTFASKAA